MVSEILVHLGVLTGTERWVVEQLTSRQTGSSEKGTQKVAGVDKAPKTWP